MVSFQVLLCSDVVIDLCIDILENFNVISQGLFKLNILVLVKEDARLSEIISITSCCFLRGKPSSFF